MAPPPVLRLAGFFPMRGAWPGGVSVRPAVEAAIADVNNDTTLLNQTELQLVAHDSACDGPTALTEGLAYQPTMNSSSYEAPIVGILGPGCSPACESMSYGKCLAVSDPVVQLHLADALKHGGLSLLSAPLNPRFYGCQRWLALVREFGWQRVGLINQAGELFDSTITAFTQYLMAAKVPRRRTRRCAPTPLQTTRPAPSRLSLRAACASSYSLAMRMLHAPSSCAACGGHVRPAIRLPHIGLAHGGLGRGGRRRRECDGGCKVPLCRAEDDMRRDTDSLVCRFRSRFAAPTPHPLWIRCGMGVGACPSLRDDKGWFSDVSSAPAVLLVVGQQPVGQHDLPLLRSLHLQQQADGNASRVELDAALRPFDAHRHRFYR